MTEIESPDGAWVFRDGVLEGASESVSVVELDVIEAWLFACFLDAETLAVACRTGQPYGEGGSWGSRLWCVAVWRLRPEGWRPIAREYDPLSDLASARRAYRVHAVAWHDDGVLAWSDDDGLEVLVVPPAAGATLPFPARSSDGGVRFEAYRPGLWTALTIAPDARALRAEGVAGVSEISLDSR